MRFENPDIQIKQDWMFTNPIDDLANDYYAVQTILRRLDPRTIFEVGTYVGNGVNTLKTACPNAQVYSLDLPPELGSRGIEYPGAALIGRDAKFSYTQLFGDSCLFDFSDYPAEVYWVDGGHFYTNTFFETKAILPLQPKAVLYHDMNEGECMVGVLDGMFRSGARNYDLVRVPKSDFGARLCYLLREDLLFTLPV